MFHRRRVRPFNRTIVELKRLRFGFCKFFAELFNRTIVELKQIDDEEAQQRHAAFNRTIVELKLDKLDRIRTFFRAFNRTIVELKQKKPMERKGSTGSFYYCRGGVSPPVFAKKDQAT